MASITTFVCLADEFYLGKGKLNKELRDRGPNESPS